MTLLGCASWPPVKAERFLTVIPEAQHDLFMSRALIFPATPGSTAKALTSRKGGLTGTVIVELKETPTPSFPVMTTGTMVVATLLVLINLSIPVARVAGIDPVALPVAVEVPEVWESRRAPIWRCAASGVPVGRAASR